MSRFKHFKKHLSVLLAFVLVFSLFPAASLSWLDGVITDVIAADIVSSGACGENVTWTLDSNGLLTISGTGEIWYTSPKDSVVSVVIVNGVTGIGDWAFYGCTWLESVTIPDSVTSIGDRAFFGCSWLTSITLPDSVTSIGESAFAGCSGITSVTIPDSVTSIGNFAFDGCSGLTSVSIPDSVTSIGNYAFAECSGLTSVTIPDNVTSIVEGAFCGCSGLTDVTIPDSVTSIGNYAFAECSGLTTVTIPDSVTSIGDDAFYECSGLTSVMIPESVTSIGESAFAGCSGLTSVTIPDSVTGIGDGAFAGCSGLAGITVSSGNTKYISIGNCIIEKDAKTLLLGCKNSVIPTDGSVTSIGIGAFYGCTVLTSVSIPESVTSIGDGAFYECSGLTSVTIPDSVTSIGDYAFAECSGLTSVTIPDSVTSIVEGAFYGCSGLTSVTIPDSVTSIGMYAFSGCSGLTDVYYNGTEAQWNAIEIGDWNEELTEATIHFNDGNGTTYYIDSVAGNDSNAGTSEGAAWKTTANIVNRTFSAGDSILFKRGGVYTVEYNAVGGGTKDAPVVIGAYGSESDPLPVIMTQDGKFTFTFIDVEYWTVRDIEFSGPSDGRAICIDVKDGVTKGISILGCSFHDMHHEPTESNYAGDYSVIAIDGTAHDGNGAHVEDILMDDLSFYTLGYGVNITGNDANTAEEPYNKNITLKNSVFHDVIDDGYILGNTSGFLIENCQFIDVATMTDHYTAPCRIENAENGVYQDCEVSGSTNTMDGMAIAFDNMTQNVIAQRIYSHDNSRFFWCTVQDDNHQYNNIVRYCLSVNDNATYNGICGYGYEINFGFYNNTLYNSNGIIFRQKNSANYAQFKDSFIQNNIFCINKARLFTPELAMNNQFSNNYLIGTLGPQIFTDDGAHSSDFLKDSKVVVDGNIKFKDYDFQGILGIEGTDFDNKDSFKLVCSSPLLNAGVQVGADMGEKDFFGNPLRSQHNIGCFDAMVTHEWSEWTEVTPAAPGVAGQNSRACSICGSVETQEIPAEPVPGDDDTTDPSEEITTGSSEELTTEPSDETFNVIPGDIDLDGYVTSEDARRALRIAAKLEDCTTMESKAADVDSNGVINTLDARIILRWAAGLDEDVTVPIGDPQSGSPKVRAVSEKTEVAIGEEFTVTVKIENAGGMISDAAWLTFDTSLLELLSTGKGDTNAYVSTSVKPYEIAKANTEGRIRNSFAYLESEENDTVTIYTATFEAIGDGTATFGFVTDEMRNLTIDNVATVTVYASSEKHSWNDGVITTAATCSSEGVKTYTCTVCGATKTEPIAKDASNHAGGTEVRDAKAATCGADGYTGDTYCKGCGIKIASGTAIPATGEHAWNSGTVTTAATCASEGVKTFTCAVCKATKTEPAAKDAANHTGGTELKNAKAATCGEAGYTGDTYCKGCGVKIASGTAIPATGEHAWNSGTVTTAATCASEGVKTYTCTVCGATKTEPIAKDASNHAGGTEVRDAKAATCGEAGYTGDTYCKGCGVKIASGTAIPATGKHAWNSGTVTTAATCSAEGVKTFTCSVCNTTKTETVAKNPANHAGGTEIKGAKAATCTEVGYTGDTYCKVCGEKIADGAAIPATGHVDKDDDGVCDVCSTVLTVPEPPTQHTTEPGDETTTRPADESTTQSSGETTTQSAGGTTTDPSSEPVNETTTVPGNQSTTTQPDTTDNTEKPTIPDNIFENPDDGAVGSNENSGEIKYSSKAALTKSVIVASIVHFEGAVVTVKDKDGNDLADDAAPGTGSTVTVAIGAITVTKVLIFMGDVDGDASVNATDARLALRAAAKLDELVGAFAEAADADVSNSINATDARMILRAAAKLDDPSSWLA